MSRTVSARIPTELHEELRERCNLVGESISDFVEAAIEFALYGSVDFDFGEELIEESEEETKTSVMKETKNHEGKKQVLHLHWDNGKLVQDETTWEPK